MAVGVFKIRARLFFDILGATLLLVAGAHLAYDRFFSAPFIEFAGVMTQTPEVPVGGKVTFVYELRRNTACSTRVHRRFARKDGSYMIEMTMNSPATQVEVSEAFVLFPLTISVEGLPEGEYSYQPLLICEETGQEVPAPPATFAVKGRGE